MINFTRMKMPKISDTELSTSSRSSTSSSFVKPELSKVHKKRGQKVTEQDTSENDTVRTSASTTSIEPKKVVRFEKTARVRRIRHRKQYSEKEHRAIWYGEEEFKDIKRHAAETVKKLAKADKRGVAFVEDEYYSARGLEDRTKQKSIARKQLKLYTLHLVLDEQQEQKDLGIKCPGSLKMVSLKASSASAMKARLAGQKDAAVAKSFR